MSDFLMSVAIAVGGMALVWAVLSWGLPLLVDKLGDAMLRTGKVRRFVFANKAKILDIMDKCEAELKKDIEADTGE